MTAEDASAQAPDPFARTGGRVQRVASWLGCTEGQLWSLTIGLLAAWTVMATGLPDVVWDRESAPPASATREGSGDEVVSAPADPTPPVLPPFALPDPSGPGLAVPDVLGPNLPVDGPTGPTPGDPAVPGPLALASGGYASAYPGTPLATAGVPAGSLAVAQRAGRPDKITYLRLRGAGPALALEVDSSGVNTLDALASVVLCPVASEGWNVGQGDVDLSDAPAYDCSRPVQGRRSAAGDVWTFDVTTLTDLDGPRGFAILPTPGLGTVDFQIVFRGVEDASSG